MDSGKRGGDKKKGVGTNIEELERELHELSVEGGLATPYVSDRFDHQLEAYINDILFVDYLLRMSQRSLNTLRKKHMERNELEAVFEVCIEVTKLAGRRKVPITWLVDPDATKLARWPSIDGFGEVIVGDLTLLTY